MGVTLREEHKLRVFENRDVEENIWAKEGWSGENCITRSFIICTLHQV
jgi:hypothetical protein